MAMLQDVLAALAAVSELADVLVVTADHEAGRIACRHGARVTTAGACDGHTGAVAAAAKLLSTQGLGLLQLPADIPLVTPDDIQRLLSLHREAPAFTIIPAHDERGSNAVLCSPAEAVPLQFGDDSFAPHIAAARARGIVPTIVRNRRIGLDIDDLDDLTEFQSTPSPTRSYALLESWRHGDDLALKAPVGRVE
jgi:2-phospho-L-lactate guanylyltransferase